MLEKCIKMKYAVLEKMRLLYIATMTEERATFEVDIKKNRKKTGRFQDQESIVEVLDGMSRHM